MAISQKLHTKLVQKLILTPSLQQAIKLLPMSTLELSDLLNQEMVENPMLEEVPTEDLQPAEAAATPEKPDPEQQQNKTDTWDDQDYEYFFGDYLDDGYRPRAPQEVKELPPIENTLSTASSLSDHLLWQLSMQTDDPLLKEIGSAIIGNLDDDGYLVATVEEPQQRRLRGGPGGGRGRRGGEGWRRLFHRLQSCRAIRERATGSLQAVAGASAAPRPRPSGSGSPARGW